MIELFSKNQECCGCTACSTICPKQSITMLKDKEGFLYPIIDNNKCIECKLCIKVCAFTEKYIEKYNYGDNLDNPIAYAVKHKEESDRATSRSGGMFVALSDFIIKNNGVIYGATFDEQFNVLHKRATTKDERDKLKGSKYVQSDMGNTFSQVKQDLLNDKYVLFVGTPCQTSGLKSYLKRFNNSKLFICDIICHGVPSPLIWENNLKFIERRYKRKIVSVNFRDKSYGWHTHIESYNLDNRKRKVKAEYFTSLFCKNIISRPCCEECKFTNLKRPSDITLGDFWGINRVLHHYKNDDKGISLVLVNTKKGVNWFDSVKDDIYYEEADIRNYLQPNLKAPSKPLIDRNRFWNDYKNNDFEFILKRYGGYNYKARIKKFIYRNIVKKFKNRK